MYISSVEPLSADDLILKFDGVSKNYFKRLRYHGCPPLTRGAYPGLLCEKTVYRNMDRDDFVRSVYRLFKANYNKNWATCVYNQLILYVRWLDNNNQTPMDGDYFNSLLIHSYLKQLFIQVRHTSTTSRLTSAKQALACILRAQGRDADARTLQKCEIRFDSFKGVDVNSELRPIAKALMTAYNVLVKHVLNGTIPDIHPLFDQERFNTYVDQRRLTPKQRIGNKEAFIAAVNQRNTELKTSSIELCKNQLTRLGIAITCVFTGMNITPLLLMRRKDVKIKSIGGDKYILESMKCRANFKLQDNTIGFTKRSKEFIESWLGVSAHIAGGDDEAWLFPYIDKENNISDFISSGARVFPQINKLLKRIGMRTINASILRQTKVDTLIKTTRDIRLVALSANNTITTISRNYSNGLESDHERELASCMEAKYSIAKGDPLVQAIKDAKFKYHDIYEEFDYKKLGKQGSYTPLGLRCEIDQTPCKTALRTTDSNNNDSIIPVEEMKCTNFLDCFNCDKHALVAATNDIWIMLSFLDVLNELENVPALNSSPPYDYKKLRATIVAILEDFKKTAQKNYLEALEKNKNSPHPLYSDVRSLNDLVEVYS